MTGVSPEQLQREFYTATADSYDATMVKEGDEHFVAIDLISALIRGYGYRSVLDVGAGTGRGVAALSSHHEGVEVRGVEPVPAMIRRAEEANGVRPGQIVEGSGVDLPFEDDAFDVVCEFGVLHHISEPAAVVREMTRVARRAVFLSDDNRFAGGRAAHRLVRYVAFRLGLWPAVRRAANRGRPYHLSADGLAYSYSVYDSLSLFDGWADRVFVVPTVPVAATWFHPLFSAKNLLVCALRDSRPT